MIEHTQSSDMSSGGSYEGQGHNRINLGTEENECYIRFENGTLEIVCNGPQLNIVCAGDIKINGKTVHIN